MASEVISKIKQRVIAGDLGGAMGIAENEIRLAEIRGKLGTAPGEYFELLDARALCYEKMRRYKQAIDDADRMIRLNPQDGRGYLRLARVYYHTKHFKKTVQVYRQALKNIDKEDCFRPQVEAQLAKAVKVSRTKFVDPLTRLPRELLIDIFTQNIHQSSDILNYILVSKSWNNFFVSEPKFWSQLNFNGKSSISPQIIKTFCQRAGTRGLHLKISCPIRQSDKLLPLLRNQPLIVTLRLEHPALLLGSLRQEAMSFRYLRDVKLFSLTIENDLMWALSNLPSLESLSIVQHGTITTGQPKAKSCNVIAPLNALTIIGTSTTPCLLPSLIECIIEKGRLTSLNLHHVTDSIRVIQPVAADTRITTLGFTCCCNRNNVPNMSFPIRAPVESLVLNKLAIAKVQHQPPQQPLPLVYLEIKWSKLENFSIAGLLSYYGCAKTINSLILHQSDMRGLGHPDDAIETYPQLQTLQLLSMPMEINRAFLNWIERTMPELKSLNVNETPIDGRSIVRLVHHGVKIIRCRGAQSVSIDTIQWARDQGVKIVFN